MKLTLTSSIQESVQSALARPDFSVVYQEEAEKIIKQDLKKAYPVSVELLQHVSKCLGMKVENERTNWQIKSWLTRLHY